MSSKNRINQCQSQLYRFSFWSPRSYWNIFRWQHLDVDWSKIIHCQHPQPFAIIPFSIFRHKAIHIQLCQKWLVLVFVRFSFAGRVVWPTFIFQNWSFNSTAAWIFIRRQLMKAIAIMFGDCSVWPTAINNSLSGNFTSWHAVHHLDYTSVYL